MHLFETLRQNPSYIIALWLVIINLASFTAMGIDKYKASHNKWRIPEKNLFLLAAIGGSIGGIAGIYMFRHKTMHKKFTLGFPAILVVQIAAAIILIYIGAK
ncbi:MAG: DUF1294 domain-containing protein [Clostridiales bacterium]|jgi:uncharacterized membrane protein YsdA (DUF1294 family)|nr:DUF1294 domain-containing protein [Clostridiales bacterium]